MTEEEVKAIGLDEGEPTITPDEAPPARRKAGRPKGSRTKRRTTRRTPSSSRSQKPPSLRAPLQAMLETVGGVWHLSELTRGHAPLDEAGEFPTCGSVLVAQAPSIATNLNTLAQSDPSVYRWLDAMMTGGGWGGVVLSVWPVAQAVLQGHVMPSIERRRAAAAIGPEDPDNLFRPGPEA